MLERERKSLAAMEEAMMKAWGNPEYMKLATEANSIIADTQVELYMVWSLKV